MTRRLPSRSQPRRGAVAAQAAVCLAALLGVAALALDGGTLYTERRHAQATADAAALAAAVELTKNRAQVSAKTPDPIPTGKTVGAGKQSALDVAAANGYANDTTRSIVTVNIPPKSGNFAGKLGYAEVIVQYNQPRAFSTFWGTHTDIPVKARAVARWDPIWDASILVLNKTASPALTLTGGSAIKVPGTVIVDSNGGSAVNLNGSGTSLTAPEIDVVGGYNPSSGAGYSPTPTKGVDVADPLASLALPNPTSLPVQSTSQMRIKSGSVTLNPGVYQGGISVTNGAIVTLSSGIYYLEGGGLMVQNTGSTLKDDGNGGVLIYNGETNGTTNNPSSVGSITIQSGGVAQLSPMSSGTWKGISIFQDRNATTAMTIKGGSGTNISGMIYAAKAAVTANGGSDIIPGVSFISDTLTLTGGSTFTLPVAIIPVPKPGELRGPGLVE
jgi:hypothetical protein